MQKKSYEERKEKFGINLRTLRGGWKVIREKKGIKAVWRENPMISCVCPITTILKITTHFSLLKIRMNSEKCNECGACMKRCPMDIRIPDYTKNGLRILSTECILCQTCVNTCPTGALKVSSGLDIGGKELLYEREQ